jgi:PEP-CTERM motif
VEQSERSWRNLAVAVGLGAAASVGTGAVASLALEMMLGGSSLDSVYQRLEARQPAVASTSVHTITTASIAPTSSSSLPEPSAWAFMIMGVGAVGVRLRARRTQSQG